MEGSENITLCLFIYILSVLNHITVYISKNIKLENRAASGVAALSLRGVSSVKGPGEGGSMRTEATAGAPSTGS